MARDKIEVDLLLNAKRAEATIKKMNRELDKMGKTMSRAFTGGGGRGGVDKVRALGTGLSKATVRADEFNKSLEASNARVIAFGASAGLIMNVEKAMRAMVASAIKVEKAMADVNVVMNASTKTLDQFGKGMFKVAKDTAQGFDTVAEAATELARQGLGMEKTLQRTKDALILTRLTGMNAADSVKSLTAAVNSFNKEGVTSAQIVNRMAKVDAAFAVSSEDLAKSISRVGSSAMDAGVSMNELMAITTAVQQKTARGGAVIGNAFKTIFTRIQRSDVQAKLKGFGIATEDMSGRMLNGIQVMQNLANNFDRLTKSQQANLAESVAGVFQINILKAAMSDLASETSNFKGALDAANSATNEAYQRNEQLNKTLDSLVNRTLANLTQAGATIGGGVFGPAIEKTLGLVNNVIESFGKGGSMEKFGQTIGKGLINGIGNFIAGPGLVLATAVFGKLALSLGKFATSALKDIVGLNAATKQRAALEEIVVATIAKEPALLEKVRSGTLNVLGVERQILATIQAQQTARKSMSMYGGALSQSLYSRGARVGKSGGAFMGGPGKAGGFIPNFANPNTERAAAAAGGYTAGAIKTMRQPGAGTMMYNSAETVKQFPGMSQKAIMPPKGSPAGAAYKSAFGAAHGFNPYAAGGFVPNFAPRASKKKIHPALAGKVYQLDASDIGVILGLADGSVKPTFNPLADAKSLVGLKNKAPQLHKDLVNEGAKIRLNNIRVESFINTPKEDQAEAMFEGILSKELKSGTGNIAKKIMTRFGIEGAPGKMGKLPAGLQGEVFEESMRMAMKAAVATPGADFDFEAGRPPSAALQKIFGQPVFRIDAKRRLKSAQGGEMPKKYFNDPQTGKHGISLLNIMRNDLMGGGRGKALGFVPNFNPLSGAIGREMAAGVPASAIRVGSSPSLRSAGNPRGLGVYNTIHEPQGLQQGIRRSRSMGINPKSHGIPNYANLGGYSVGPVTGIDQRSEMVREEARAADQQEKAAKDNKDSAKTIKSSAMKMERAGNVLMFASMAASMGGPAVASSMGARPSTQAAVSGLSNVASMAMMGAGAGLMTGNPLLALGGGLAGAAVGALGVDYGMAFGDEGRKADAQQLKDQADSISESLAKVSAAIAKLGDLDVLSVEQKITNFAQAQKEIIDLEEKLLEGGEEMGSVRERFYQDPRIQKIREGKVTQLDKDSLSTLQAVLSSIRNRAEDVMSAGSFLDFETRLTNSGNVKQNLNILQRGIARDGGTPTQSQKDKIRELQFQRNKGIMGTFGTGTQVEMATAQIAQQTAGGVVYTRGQDFLKQYERQMEAGDTKGALKTMIHLFEQTGQSNKAQAFKDLLGTMNRKGANQVTQKDIDRLLDPSKVRGGTFSVARSASPAGAELLSQLEEGRKGGLLSMMFGAAPAKKKELTADQRKKAQEAADALRVANQGAIGMFDQARGAGRAAANNLALGTARIARQSQAGTLDRRLRGAMNSVTLFGKSLINANKTLEEERILEEKDLADKKARLEARMALDTMEAKARETFFKNLAGEKGMTGPQKDQLSNQLLNIMELTEADQQNVRKALIGEENRTPQQNLILDYLNTTLQGSADIREKEKTAITNNTEAYAQNSSAVTKNAESQLKLFKAQEKFIRRIEAGRIKSEFRKARNRVPGLQDLQDRGFGISNQEIAAAAQDARLKRFRAGKGGINSMQNFREVFSYGENDALLEFDSGVRDVAQNMKSSFASAFQSISTGATSVKGALANMAQSILNSINQMSSQIFTNMLFAKMAPGTPTAANGGYIRGYAGGGLVTGGSGYKDDVLTKMSGGEFVIKKSAVNKIGVGTLNAINGYANGGKAGPGMGAMGMLALGSGAASGIIGAAMADGPDKPIRMQNYGKGRNELGYLGGADIDAGQVDSIGGGPRSASTSLAKGFVYYTRDPKTGRLISERARPTEGRFEVSDSLSLMGRLSEGDPQTARMFEKEQRLGSYLDYVAGEKASRKAQIQAVKDQKRARTMGAFVNAAMLIGGAKLMSMGNKPQLTDMNNPADPMTSTGMPQSALDSHGGRMNYTGFTSDKLGSHGMPIGVGNANGGLAKVMGGEYIMSPQAVRTHGVGFMTELNRGNVPGYASGGLVGGGGGGSTVNNGGNTTNNVKINISIDKKGKAEVESGATTAQSGGNDRDDQGEAQSNAKFGEIIQGMVLEEIVKQQRPGGLLTN